MTVLPVSLSQTQDCVCWIYELRPVFRLRIGQVLADDSTPSQQPAVCDFVQVLADDSTPSQSCERADCVCWMLELGPVFRLSSAAVCELPSVGGDDSTPSQS